MSFRCKKRNNQIINANWLYIKKAWVPAIITCRSKLYNKYKLGIQLDDNEDSQDEEIDPIWTHFDLYALSRGNNTLRENSLFKFDQDNNYLRYATSWVPEIVQDYSHAIAYSTDQPLGFPVLYRLIRRSKGDNVPITELERINIDTKEIEIIAFNDEVRQVSLGDPISMVYTEADDLIVLTTSGLFKIEVEGFRYNSYVNVSDILTTSGFEDYTCLVYNGEYLYAGCTDSFIRRISVTNGGILASTDSEVNLIDVGTLPPNAIKSMALDGLNLYAIVEVPESYLIAIDLVLDDEIDVSPDANIIGIGTIDLFKSITRSNSNGYMLGHMGNASSTGKEFGGIYPIHISAPSNVTEIFLNGPTQHPVEDGKVMAWNPVDRHIYSLSMRENPCCYGEAADFQLIYEKINTNTLEITEITIQDEIPESIIGVNPGGMTYFEDGKFLVVHDNGMYAISDTGVIEELNSSFNPTVSGIARVNNKTYLSYAISPALAEIDVLTGYIINNGEFKKGPEIVPENGINNGIVAMCSFNEKILCLSIDYSGEVPTTRLIEVENLIPIEGAYPGIVLWETSTFFDGLTLEPFERDFPPSGYYNDYNETQTVITINGITSEEVESLEFQINDRLNPNLDEAYSEAWVPIEIESYSIEENVADIIIDISVAPRLFRARYTNPISGWSYYQWD